MVARKRKRGCLKTLLVCCLVGVPVIVLGLWLAIHRFAWLGPWLADTTRSVVGTEPVAKAEDIAYGIADRWNRFRASGSLPEAQWEVPDATTAPFAVDASVPEVFSSAPTDSAPSLPSPSSSATSAATSAAASAPLALAPLEPMHKAWAAPGDGVWVAVTDELAPNEAPVVFKTLLHPDRRRSFTSVTVMALDMERLRLHLVPGKWEPKATERGAMGMVRTGLIPSEDLPRLVAAFNGGFKYEHGRYGMRVGATTIVRPRAKVCTVASTAHGVIQIGSWEKFSEGHEELLWWRQTPYCMWEDNVLHLGLRSDDATTWGATVDGDTVIRRSAIGVGPDPRIVYMGIGDSTTARAMAMAMRHAGATNVGQLDVNWSFPKFVMFGRKPDTGELVCVPVSKTFEYDESDFVRKPYARDFFYVTRKPQPAP